MVLSKSISLSLLKWAFCLYGRSNLMSNCNIKNFYRLLKMNNSIKIVWLLNIKSTLTCYLQRTIKSTLTCYLQRISTWSTIKKRKVKENKMTGRVIFRLYQNSRINMFLRSRKELIYFKEKKKKHKDGFVAKLL